MSSKNNRDLLDNVTYEWEQAYRAYVEEFFWEILRQGLDRCEVKYSDGYLSTEDGDWIKSGKLIHVAPVIEELLFPQVLFVGLISTACKEILCCLDWKGVREDEDYELTSAKFISFFHDLDEDCAKVIKSLSRGTQEYTLGQLFRGLSDKIDVPGMPKEERLTKAESFFRKMPIAFLRKEVFELRKMDSNSFSGKIENMLEKAKDEHRIMTVKEILEFSYEEMINPGEAEKDLDLSDPGVLVDLRKNICDKISGQDSAVRQFINGLFEGQLSFGEKKGPMCTFLFVGPPGVGKTYLSDEAAKLLKRPFKLFQMNEYANENDFKELIGYDVNYKAPHPGTMTSFVKHNPNAVLLFDEIEKAHINTIRQFLSVLE